MLNKMSAICALRRTAGRRAALHAVLIYNTRLSRRGMSNIAQHTLIVAFWTSGPRPSTGFFSLDNEPAHASVRTKDALGVN